MGRSLPKKSLLRKPWQYRRVYAAGRRVYGPGVTLVFAPNGLDEDRLGISVSGVKLATRRNRIKRLLREFFRHERAYPSRVAGGTGGVDLVIAVKKTFSPSCLADVTDSLTRLAAGGRR